MFDLTSSPGRNSKIRLRLRLWNRRAVVPSTSVWGGTMATVSTSSPAVEPQTAKPTLAKSWHGLRWRSLLNVWRLEPEGNFATDRCFSEISSGGSLLSCFTSDWNLSSVIKSHWAQRNFTRSISPPLSCFHLICSLQYKYFNIVVVEQAENGMNCWKTQTIYTIYTTL